MTIVRLEAANVISMIIILWEGKSTIAKGKWEHPEHWINNDSIRELFGVQSWTLELEEELKS